MKHVFLMDPLDCLDYSKDTTVALIHSVLDRGDSAFFLSSRGVHLDSRGIFFHVHELYYSSDQYPRFEMGDMTVVLAETIQILWVRLDPPFDINYLTLTWLLDQAPPSLLILNNPSGIRTVNEKIWCHQFRDFIPETLITYSKNHFDCFFSEHQTIILKPIHLYGGQGVFKLNFGDTNAKVAFETLSQGASVPVICQQYVPEASAGDKRILLLRGEPLGAVLRYNQTTDHRHNVMAGGGVQLDCVTTQDRVITDALCPFLNALGLFFVGIDVIGGKLIEVNVTSPTCLVELSSFSDVDLVSKVVESAVDFYVDLF